VSLRSELGYGDSYGSKEYPFFENYTAGGVRSVRGYEDNTLGPADSEGRPYGGNLKVVGNIEFFMPMPFIKDSKTTRLTAFIDGGNVYGLNEDFDVGNIRYSAGIGLVWLSPLGGLKFSIAKALNPQDGDETQAFQFTIGANF
jgi:outer membrane protein insertion porin family